MESELGPVPAAAPGQTTLAIMPRRKQKQRAECMASSPKDTDSTLILCSQESDLSDFDLVLIPSDDDNYGTAPEDCLNNMIIQ